MGAFGSEGIPTGSLRGKEADGVIAFAPPEEHRGNVARARLLGYITQL